MAGSADFNLVGEISLQLAAGAAKKLRDDIQKGFQAPLEVDTKQAEDKIKKAKKKASDPIVVPITFELNKDAKDKAKKGIGTIAVEGVFTKTSLKALTNANLKKLLGEKTFTVPIEVKFGPKTEAKLKSVQDRIEKLAKYEERLKKVLAAKNIDLETITNPQPLNIPNPIKPATVVDSIDETKELIKQIQRLAKLSKETDKRFNLQRAPEGGFFQFADKQIKDIITQLTNLGSSDAFNLLKRKFEGLDGKINSNLIPSLRTLYKAFLDIDLQASRLQTAKSLSPNVDKQKFQDQLDVLDNLKKELGDYFLKLDSSDTASFGTIVSNSMSKAKDSTSKFISTTTREVRDLDKLLTQLLQKQQSIAAGGASNEQNTLMSQLIGRVQTLGGQGMSVLDIKKDATVQRLGALVAALRNTDILADRASSSVESLLRKTSKGELKNTFGGQLVDLAGRSSSVGKNTAIKIAQARAAGGAGNKAINDLQKEAAEDIAVIAQRAEKVNRIYERIQNTVSSLKTSGFTKLASDVEDLIPKLEQLVKRGDSIQNIDLFINDKLNKSLNIKGFETKINTAVKQIERLRVALNFGSSANDVSGATKTLDELENKVKNLVSSGTFDPAQLDKTMAEGVFNVRGANKINEAIDTTIYKLQALGNADDNLQVGAIFEKHSVQFEQAATKIARSTDSVGVKLNQLKKLSADTLFRANFEAQGGFFGSLAKAAGLAAKRLGAFLILAQGLYSVQSLFTTAFSDAVSIDREFVKLEQVFNKDFSGAALVKSLQKVESQILSLGKNLGVATLEVANSAQILAQAGIQGKKLEVLLDTVAKSQLGPSFASSTETAEAAIAIMNQFNLTAEETTAALGGINKISAQYAVEAKGITEAVRRAGGVFSTGGDTIESFAASFTLIKQSTREADESIATALRNVAQRLQSSRIQDYIKKTLGVDLVEDGSFIGFEKAISKIGQAIKAAGIDKQSPLFSQIREQIAGRLQAGRITPLLEDFTQYDKLVKDFRSGAKSIEEDTKVAFESIENKVLRAKGAVVELFTEIINTKAFKVMVEGFTQVTIFVSNLLRALNSLPGAILGVAIAMKSFGTLKFAAGAALSQFHPRNSLFGRNSGGHIPGYGPNKDSMLAAVTPGEYVIPRDVVNEYGVPYFDALIKRNKGGVIPGYNTGGLIGLLGKAGFNLDQGILDKLVKKFSIESLPKGIRGKANTKAQSIALNTGNANDLDVLAHEFGHILTSQLDKTQLVKVMKDLPVELKNQTYSRVASAPDSYGTVGSPKFQKSLQREIQADAVRALSAQARGSQQYKGNQGLQDLAGLIKSKFGIGIGGGANKTSNIISTIRAAHQARFNDARDEVLGLSGPQAIKSTSVSKGDMILASSAGGLSGVAPTTIASGATRTVTGPTNLPPAANLASIKLAEGMTKITKSIGGLRAAINNGFYGTIKLLQNNLGKAAILFGALSLVAGQVNDGLGDLGLTLLSGGAAGYGAATSGKLVTDFLKKRSLKRAGEGFGGPKTDLSKDILSKFKAGEITAKEARNLAAGQVAKKQFRALGSKVASSSAAPLVGQKGLGALLGRSAPNLVKAMGGLAKNLNVVGVIAGVLTAGLSYFASKAEETAKESFDSAQTLEEAQMAASKGRFAKALQAPIDKLGSLLMNTITGVSLGSFAGIPGMIIGGIAGVLFTYGKEVASMFKNLLPTSWVENIASAVSTASKFISKKFQDLADTYYGLANGTEALAAEYTDVANQFALNKLSGKVKNNKNQGKGTEIALTDIGTLLQTTKVAGGIITQGGGNFQDLADEPAAKVKQDLEKVAEVFNMLSTDQQTVVLDAFRRSGTDLQALMDKVGVEINYAEQASELAFDRLTNFFEGLKNSVERAGARSTGLEAGLSVFASGGNLQSTQFAPDQIFDVLGAGFNLSEVGLEDFGSALKESNSLIKSFDKGLYDAYKLQVNASIATRKSKQVVAASGDVRLKNSNAETVEQYLKEVFSAASGGDQTINDAFDRFLNTKIDKLDDLAKDGGRLDASEVNALFTEFADSLDKGALEEAKRINQITNQWGQQIQDGLAKQAEVVKRMTDIQLENIDKQKTLNDIVNKASGKSDAELAPIKLKQAKEIDKAKIGAINPRLAGAAGSPGIAIKAAIKQINEADQILNGGGNFGGGIAGKQAEAEAMALAKIQKEQAQETLRYYANGTEVNRINLENFEKAAERAAAATARLSNALLGTDQQMLDSVKGIVAFQQVQKAYESGGTKAAQAQLLQYNEEARQALQSRISGDAQAEAQFNKMIGINPNLNGSNEFKQVQRDIATQQEANNGLNVGNVNELSNLQQNQDQMNKFFSSQFTRAQEIVQQAENTTKQLVADLANIPNLITHEGNIQVNIVGAGALEALQEGMQDFITTQINHSLEKYGADLIKRNNGLKVPSTANKEGK